MSEFPQMETIDRTAELSNIPAHRIREWCKTGEICAVKAGKKYLINIPRFIEFLNNPPPIEATEEPQEQRGGIRRVGA